MQKTKVAPKTWHGLWNFTLVDYVSKVLLYRFKTITQALQRNLRSSEPLFSEMSSHTNFKKKFVCKALGWVEKLWFILLVEKQLYLVGVLKLNFECNTRSGTEGLLEACDSYGSSFRKAKIASTPFFSTPNLFIKITLQ